MALQETETGIVKEEVTRKGSALGWFSWYVFLILIGMGVPYLFLSNVTSFFGAFFFWIVTTIVTIISIVIMTRTWRA